MNSNPYSALKAAFESFSFPNLEDVESKLGNLKVSLNLEPEDLFEASLMASFDTNLNNFRTFHQYIRNGRVINECKPFIEVAFMKISISSSAQYKSWNLNLLCKFIFSMVTYNY
jgi:hypothetical protein